MKKLHLPNIIQRNFFYSHKSLRGGKRTKFLFLLFFFVVSSLLFGQKNSIKIWKDVPTMNRVKTRLFPFPAPDSLNTSTAIIICPGGSYHHLGLYREGFKTARWLRNNGITAFVLKYRVSMHGYHHPAMIEDLQRAIEWVRLHSQEYAIDNNKIGVMGYSAGGHLALMSAIFNNINYLDTLTVNSSVRLSPDFVIAIYPVVSMQDNIAHKRSRKSLLSKFFTNKEKETFSLELQVPPSMPPVFLLASKDDKVVDYRNSLLLSEALEQQHIKYKFLLYDTGGHGYGMTKNSFTEKTKWPSILQEWLYQTGFLYFCNHVSSQN